MIRNATKQDAPQLSHLALGLSHYYLINKGAPLPNWLACTLTISEFEKRIENDYFTHLIYQHKDDIVGFIAMRGENHLHHLFVSETIQRTGIATRLWLQLKATCPSSVYSLRSSIFAVPVYKKFGFKAQGDPGEREGIRFQKMYLSHRESV